MKVSQLIAALEQYDGDSEVLFVSQPSYPFEYSIHHVISREDILYDDDDDDSQDPPRNDVLIVEGSQLRYGNKDCWSFY